MTLKKTAALLAVSAVSCGSPTAPSPIEQPKPVPSITVEVTAHVTLPYWNGSPVYGISGVLITCLSCPDGQSDTTDSEGAFTLTEVVPLVRIRAEKSGYETAEVEVHNGGRVMLGHEWPPESAGSFRRLTV